MVEINYIDALRILTFIAGLLTLIVASYVLYRCSGKIKKMAGLVIIATLFMIFKKIMTWNTLETSYGAWLDFGMVICFLLIAYSMKKIIDEYDLENKRNIISSASGIIRRPHVETYS